jgi:hypothetical protein
MRQNAKKIAERIDEQEIARAAAALSEPAFQAIWDNPEDDAYDMAFARE